jgi:putative Mn2+ efflux pump MntP
MLKKVDLLAVFGAAMMAAGLVCFLTGNYLPVWATYLGGPMLWFLGTVFGIIWMVLRGVPDLDSADVQEKSEAEVESIIAKGKNKMPAY